MKYFAELSGKNRVMRVIVADSLTWCESNLGGRWIETFKDGSERFNYASTGYNYDEARDAFIPPKPYPSWILVEETCLWEAPIPFPQDGNDYVWDEIQGDWVQVVEG